jgi:uncharacterized protein HemX
MFKKKQTSEFPTISKHDNIDYDSSLKTYKNVTESYTTATGVSQLITPKRMVILAVAAGVGIGYYFYSKNKKKSTPQHPTSQATSQAKGKEDGKNTSKLKGFIIPLIVVVIAIGGFVFWKKKKS